MATELPVVHVERNIDDIVHTLEEDAREQKGKLKAKGAEKGTQQEGRGREEATRLAEGQAQAQVQDKGEEEVEVEGERAGNGQPHTERRPAYGTSIEAVWQRREPWFRQCARFEHLVLKGDRDFHAQTQRFLGMVTALQALRTPDVMQPACDVLEMPLSQVLGAGTYGRERLSGGDGRGEELSALDIGRIREFISVRATAGVGETMKGTDTQAVAFVPDALCVVVDTRLSARTLRQVLASVSQLAPRLPLGLSLWPTCSPGVVEEEGALLSLYVEAGLKAALAFVCLPESLYSALSPSLYLSPTRYILLCAAQLPLTFSSPSPPPSPLLRALKVAREREDVSGMWIWCEQLKQGEVVEDEFTRALLAWMNLKDGRREGEGQAEGRRYFVVVYGPQGARVNVKDDGPAFVRDLEQSPVSLAPIGVGRGREKGRVAAGVGGWEEGRQGGKSEGRVRGKGGMTEGRETGEGGEREGGG